MNKRATASFARKFRGMLEEDGVAALDRFGWAERFRELGFEMDCGHSYEEKYGLPLGEKLDAETGFPRIDSVVVLGNAVFSQCRYLTHWSGGYGEEAAVWLIGALRRLEELCEPTNPHVQVSYRFADAVECAVVAFCERALDGEELPALIEYSVADTHALDACVDEVSCFIPSPGGDVHLQLLASVTSWRYPDQGPEDRVPSASVVSAVRTVWDPETGDDIELAWDDEKGAWGGASKLGLVDLSLPRVSGS